MGVAFVRTIILYVVLIIAIRLMGKRQIGELAPSELVVAVLMSELAAVPMQDLGTPLLYGVIPIFTLMCLTLFMSTGMMKSLRFRSLMCGRPSILMQSGRIIQSEMRRNRVSIDELIEELRGQNITDLSTVQYAILETNGKLSAMLYPEFQPSTKKDAGVNEQSKGLPIILINDGATLEENRQIVGVDRSWVEDNLRRHGIDNRKKVFLMIVDECRNVYCQPKEENA